MSKIKTGIDYFPFDVDLFEDEKIQFVSARFGLKGEAIAVRILCKIYRNGYYIDWNDDIALLFAKSVGDGVQHSLVNDIVYELLKRGFFDGSIFERFSVLTSAGIQKRYLEATSRRKRTDIAREYLLISDLDIVEYKNVNIVVLNVDINAENANIFPQSKEKESKEKNNTPPTPPTGGNSDTVHKSNDGLKEELNGIFDSYILDAALKQAVKDWIKYKKGSKKKHPYRPIGLTKLMNKIQKSAQLYGSDRVIEVIDESIANGYMGIVWDRLESNGKSGYKTQTQRTYDAAKRVMEEEGSAVDEFTGIF